MVQLLFFSLPIDKNIKRRYNAIMLIPSKYIDLIDISYNSARGAVI